MRKKFKMLFLVVFCATNILFGQKVSNIDFDLIKTKTQDSTSMYYYPELIERFLQFDSTLSEKDYCMIYYGNVFFGEYNPYNTSKNEEKLNEKIKQKKYKDAIPLGEKELKINPVNLDVLYKLMLCYHQLDDKITGQKYANLYYGILNEIYKSGDGKSVETAYVVIKVSDEYDILADLNLSITSQSLVGMTDKLTIDTKGQKPKEGEKKIKELYFDVSQSFNFLMKQFE